MKQKTSTTTSKKRIALDKDVIADLEAAETDAELLKGGGIGSHVGTI